MICHICGATVEVTQAEVLSKKRYTTAAQRANARCAVRCGNTSLWCVSAEWRNTILQYPLC